MEHLSFDLSFEASKILFIILKQQVENTIYKKNRKQRIMSLILYLTFTIFLCLVLFACCFV